MENQFLKFYNDAYTHIAHTQKYTACLLWVFNNCLVFNKTF